MKLFIRFVLFLIFLFIGNIYAQINQTDSLGKKTGYWVILSKQLHAPAYQPLDTFEKGNYSNGKKTGLWTCYHPGNIIKSKISFLNGRPNGFFSLYDEQGCLLESGTWVQNRYVGKYISRSNNNGIQVFYFNPSGKKSGEQFYYYPTGEIMYYMILDSLGHEKLSISYERDGKVKKYNYPQKYTDKGEPINTIKDSVHIPNEKKKINPLDYFGLCYTIPKTQASPKMDTLLKIWPDPEPDPHKHCNGYQKLYSSGKLLKYEGVFKNCKLWEGKHYKYDLNGLLVKIEIYKEGKYFGDAKID